MPNPLLVIEFRAAGVEGVAVGVGEGGRCAQAIAGARGGGGPLR